MTIGAHIASTLEIPRPERTPFEPGDPDETAIVYGGDVNPAAGIVSGILSSLQPFASETAIATNIGGP